MLLWQSVVLSFTTQNWIAVVLGVQAMCERGLAAIYELQGAPPSATRGVDASRVALGTLLKWAREDGVSDADVLDLVQVACDRRKVLTHWQLPMSEGTLLSRLVLERSARRVSFEDQCSALLAADAKIATDAVFAFCFGGQWRVFRSRDDV